MSGATDDAWKLRSKLYADAFHDLANAIGRIRVESELLWETNPDGAVADSLDRILADLKECELVFRHTRRLLRVARRRGEEVETTCSPASEREDPEGLRILVVEDDDVFRRRLENELSHVGCDVTTATCVDEGVEATRPFDAAAIDLRLSDGSGLEVARELTMRDHPPVIVAYSAHATLDMAVAAVQTHADHFMQRPFDGRDLVDVVLGASEAVAHPTSSSLELPTLERRKWEYVHFVYELVGENVTRAAEVLGVARRTVQRTLQSPAPTR